MKIGQFKIVFGVMCDRLGDAGIRSLFRFDRVVVGSIAEGTLRERFDDDGLGSIDLGVRSIGV